MVRLAIDTEREADGRWIAELPDLPGAMAYGRTRREAVENAVAIAREVLPEHPLGHDGSEIELVTFDQAEITAHRELSEALQRIAGQAMHYAEDFGDPYFDRVHRILRAVSYAVDLRHETGRLPDGPRTSDAAQDAVQDLGDRAERYLALHWGPEHGWAHVGEKLVEVAATFPSNLDPGGRWPTDPRQLGNLRTNAFTLFCRLGTLGPGLCPNAADRWPSRFPSRLGPSAAATALLEAAASQMTTAQRRNPMAWVTLALRVVGCSRQVIDAARKARTVAKQREARRQHGDGRRRR